MRPQDLHQQRARAAPDVHDRADRGPIVRRQDLRIRSAVPGRAHQGVEIGCDVRVGVEIFPERTPEHCWYVGARPYRP